MNLVIREYQDCDFTELLKLLADTGLLFPPLDRREAFSLKIRSSPNSILVAESDSSIVGAVIIIVDPWASFVFHLAVRPECQKRGVGSTLLQHAESVIRSCGSNRAYIMVDKGKVELLKFYNSRGWNTVGAVFDLEKVFSSEYNDNL